VTAPPRPERVVASAAPLKGQIVFERAGCGDASQCGVFVMNDIIELPAEPLTVRVGVTSKALGKTGTAHLSITVPNYLDNALQMSPIMIGSEASVSDATTAFDIIRELVPFQPTTARVFAPTETLRIFARAYWRASDTTAEAIVSVLGAGAPAPRRLKLTGEVPAIGRRQTALDTEVPLAGLAPGHYVLHVETRLAKGKPAIREVPFEVRQFRTARSARSSGPTRDTS